MRRVFGLLALVVAAACVPQYASAQGIIDLAWDACAVNSSTADRSFACQSDAGSFHLLGMYTPDAPTRYQGAEGTFLITVAGSSLPNWWRFGTGLCRAGALTYENPVYGSGCTAAHNSFGSTDGWAIQEPGPQPYQTRLRIAWGSTELSNLSAGVRAVFSAQLRNSYAVGPSPNSMAPCQGCSAPACIELQSIQIYHGSSSSATVTAAGRRFVTWQGGNDGHGVVPPRCRRAGLPGERSRRPIGERSRGAVDALHQDRAVAGHEELSGQVVGLHERRT
jgi:hypothetical protein